MRLAVTLAALVLATSSAMAQPAMTAPTQPASHGEELDPAVALTLSLGGTAAAYGLIGAAVGARSGTLGDIGMLGTLLAPSFGHWYAGKYIPRGMLLRGLGIVTFVVGALADNEGCSLFYGGHGDPEPEDCGDNFRTPEGTTMMIAGMALFAGGTIDDIVTAPGRARRHNDRIRALAVSVAPVVRHDGGGLALVGRF